MPETKRGNTEQLKQRSFLLLQRLSSEEVITKKAPGGGGALKCHSRGKGKKEGTDGRKGAGNPATALQGRCRCVYSIWEWCWGHS